MRVSDKKLSDDELLKGYKMTLENAKQLIEDADILKNAGNLPRAYTLFQLSIEEVGKSAILWRALVESQYGTTITSKYLKSQGFSKHETKTQESLYSELATLYIYETSTGNSAGTVGEEIIDEFNNVDKYNLRKNRSLYVDINDDDKFVSPLTEITIELVEQISDNAKLRFVIESNGSPTTLDEIKETAARLKELENNPDKLTAVLNKLGLK